MIPMSNLNLVCIQPYEDYTLQFYPECNQDDVIRNDLRDIFFNNPDHFDFYDIKVYSKTPIDQYNEIFSALEKNLSTRSKTVHISNAPHMDEMWHLGYEEFSANINLIDHMLNIVLASKHIHSLQFHVKKKHDQKWNEIEHNECIEQIIAKVESATNIKHMFINVGIHVCEWIEDKNDPNDEGYEIEHSCEDVEIYNKHYLEN